jgi:hypothetical protein
MAKKNITILDLLEVSAADVAVARQNETKSRMKGNEVRLSGQDGVNLKRDKDQVATLNQVAEAERAIVNFLESHARGMKKLEAHLATFKAAADKRNARAAKRAAAKAKAAAKAAA